MARKKINQPAQPRPASGLNFLEDMLELPAGLTSGMAHIGLMGNREAIVDGCRGILEYGDSVVRLNTGRGAVKFTGRELNIRSLTPEQAIVEGFIIAVEFET